MSEIVVLGASLGGTLAALELVPEVSQGDRVTLVGESNRFRFVPSNPWVAVGWRERRDIEVDLEAVARQKGIRLLSQGARCVNPSASRLELNDGESLPYDYLVIATGPELAFDEIEGLGPAACAIACR